MAAIDYRDPLRDYTPAQIEARYRRALRRVQVAVDAWAQPASARARWERCAPLDSEILTDAEFRRLRAARVSRG